MHFIRNALAYANKTQRRIVSVAIGTVFVQETAAAATSPWRSVADQFREKLPKLSAMMDLHHTPTHHPAVCLLNPVCKDAEKSTAYGHTGPGAPPLALRLSKVSGRAAKIATGAHGMSID